MKVLLFCIFPWCLEVTSAFKLTQIAHLSFSGTRENAASEALPSVTADEAELRNEENAKSRIDWCLFPMLFLLLSLPRQLAEAARSQPLALVQLKPSPPEAGEFREYASYRLPGEQ
jgi:hypothetical protein